MIEAREQSENADIAVMHDFIGYAYFMKELKDTPDDPDTQQRRLSLTSDIGAKLLNQIVTVKTSTAYPATTVNPPIKRFGQVKPHAPRYAGLGEKEVRTYEGTNRLYVPRRHFSQPTKLSGLVVGVDMDRSSLVMRSSAALSWSTDRYWVRMVDEQTLPLVHLTMPAAQ